MANSRVVRGRATQRLVAEWFAARGWPHATSRGASEAGEDVLGMGRLSVEVKASSRGNLTAALRQAAANQNGAHYSLVVWRPDGFGPERQGEWVACMSLAQMTALLAEAGYTHE